MNEPVGENGASPENGCALFSAMLFLLLFHCLNTQMDSSSGIVCLSVCPYVCLSVTQLAWQGRASLPMHSEISRGILDGKFLSHSSYCEVTSFLALLISSVSLLLQMHSGPEVIGNAVTAWCWNNVFKLLWIFLGGQLEPLSLWLSLSRVLLSLPLAPSCTFRASFPCLCNVTEGSAVLCSCRIH